MIAEVQQSDIKRILENQDDCFMKICRLILPGDWEKGLLCMLACYIDESTASNEKDPATCVVGYLATAEQWVKFKSDWNSYLDTYGVEVFHATELETEIGRQGTVYERWDRMKRDGFQSGLIQIIRDNTIVDVGAGIPCSVYEAVMTPQRSNRMGVKNIDELCALLCMFDAGYQAQKLGRQAPAYIYERGGKYWSAISTAHEELCGYPGTSGHFRDSTLSNAPKGREYAPTQAADYLAFNWSKEVSHRFDPEPLITKPRYPLIALYKERRPGVLYYSAEQLEVLIQEMEIEMNI